MLSKKEYEQLKKEIEPVEKLAIHDDADGISSGVLFSFAFKVKQVWAPEDFGVWNISPMKKGGQVIYPPDVCLDMVPQNPEWIGLAIDHHPGHKPENERNYRLIWGEEPASILVYKLFKNWIPREQRWKVVVGGVGDGVPELIPAEIWREYPHLLEDSVSIWESYGRLETRNYPLYLRLSSPINAACKLPGKWYVAYTVLRNAKTPWDILKDPALQAAKRFLDDEHKRILRETSPMQLRNGIRLWAFSSEAKLERTLAWELWEKDKRTCIAFNMQTNRGSIRGTLATLVYEHLQAHKINASGHPGFGGIRLNPDQNIDDLYRVLTQLKI